MTAPHESTVLDDLHRLLEIVQRHQPASASPALADRLAEHLGVDPAEVAVLAEDVAAHRYVDFDIALQLVAERDPDNAVIGVGGGDMRYHNSLADLLQGHYGPRTPVGQPDYTVLPDSATSERRCLGFGVRLFRFGSVPVAVLEREANPRRGVDTGSLEVLAADTATASALLAEVRDLATRHSVLRGQVITLQDSGFEQTSRGITFLPRPEVAASDVILPVGTLDRLKQHVLGIAEHADALRAQGQHLKRGVLMYGPPGTGKTHTLRHLIGAASQHTIVLLSGVSLRHVGLAARIARALQPAMVVLEDVDLVAGDRDMYGTQPLLFEVMDAMDGLDGDSDVTFLLTTNRVEAMEHALTQRPGRVDLAAEIPLPDLAAREALVALYAPVGAFSPEAIAEVAGRLDGTTASLAKELVRRAVLLATVAGVPVGDEHLREATDALTSDAEEMSRVLLGGRRPAPEAGDGPWGSDLSTNCQ